MVLCCVCLLENLLNVNSFDNLGIELNVAEIINKHLWFKPILNDPLTSKICTECWDKIYDFHNFYVRVEKLHREFKEKQTYINMEDIPSTSNIQQENNNFNDYVVKVEIDEDKISPNSEHTTNLKTSLEYCVKSEKDYEFENDLEEHESSEKCEQDYECNTENVIDNEKILTYSELTTNFKTSLDYCVKNEKGCEFENDLEGDEFSEIMEQDYKCKDEIVIDDEKISENYELTTNLKTSLDYCVKSEKGCEFENDLEEYESFEICELDYEHNAEAANKKFSNNIKKAAKEINAETKTDTPKVKRRFRKLDRKLTSEIIKKHIKMACKLCNYVGNAFSDIAKHFKDHHKNIKPYIMCCDRKLTGGYYIAEHAYIHENPNSFSCTECSKSFTSSFGLRAHNLSYHAPEEERTYACEHCPRKFGRRNLLELHKKTHIPEEEWTIVCTKCTKQTVKFPSQYLFKRHNQVSHKRVIRTCQECSKQFKSKEPFEKHVRSHFEVSGPSVKCPFENCKSWLKDEPNLKRHIYFMHDGKKGMKCPHCEKVCPNRSALASHKQYSHSSLNCEYCNKTLRNSLLLKEHMTQHTGETLCYNCPICSMTFNTYGKLRNHRRLKHSLELQELRKRKLELQAKLK